MKKIPKFSSEAEEQKFWKEADSTEYIDWSKAKAWGICKFKTIFKNHFDSSSGVDDRGIESVGEQT